MQTLSWMWPNSVRHVWHWTRKGFGGDPVGLSSQRGKDHQTCARDPGEWPHDWQSGRFAACQAHLRSHSGCNAGLALAHAPTAREFTTPPHLFRMLLLERLRLPLLLTEAACEACHEPLDPLGWHRAACPHTGRLKKWATKVERTLAHICREAGARVKFNALLRDMNVGVRATDDRKIEVLAQDSPRFGGAQLAIDVTLRSAVGRNGEARPHAAEVDGAVLLQARTDKEIRYQSSRRGDAGLSWWQLRRADVGARRRSTSCGSCLAQRAQDVPHFMTHQAALVWERRWSRMLSTACALAFAASLVEPAQCDHMCEAGGEPPSLAEVLLHDPR